MKSLITTILFGVDDGPSEMYAYWSVILDVNWRQFFYPSFVSSVKFIIVIVKVTCYEETRSLSLTINENQIMRR